MKDIPRDIRELVSQVQKLPHGPAEIELLDEAIRLADNYQRADLGFSLRKLMLSAAAFGGAPDKLLVAFSWCLSQCDEDPEQFPEVDILWEYKWVIGNLRNFPQISRDKVEELYVDMDHRLKKNGFSDRPVLKLRWRSAMHSGEMEKAAMIFNRWKIAPIDRINDPAVGDRNDVIEYECIRGNYEKALRIAAPILSGELVNEGAVPHTTLGMVVLPLFHLNQVKRAVNYHYWGIQLMNKNPQYLYQFGQHLEFLALTGNLERGLRILEAVFLHFLQSKAYFRKFQFALGALLLFRILREDNRQEIALKLPKSFPLYEKEGRYSTESIITWLEAELEEIANLFANHFQNRHAHQTIARQADLQKLRRDYPIHRK